LDFVDKWLPTVIASGDHIGYFPKSSTKSSIGNKMAKNVKKPESNTRKAEAKAVSLVKKNAANGPQGPKTATRNAAKRVPQQAPAVIGNFGASATIVPADQQTSIFTGIVSLDHNLITASLNGTPMTMENGCDDNGFHAAFRAFQGREGQQVSVTGFTGTCSLRTVIHVV